MVSMLALIVNFQVRIDCKTRGGGGGGFHMKGAGMLVLIYLKMVS